MALRRFGSRTRRVCLITLVIVLASVAGSRVSSQAGLTIGGYQLVSEQVQKNGFVDTYKATLTNGTGAALASATATIKNIAGSAKVIDGTLTFGPVGAGASVSSTDTFSFSRSGNGKFDLSTLTWMITSTPN